MKKINLNKRSTEFGTYHEHENEINSNYDSLGDSYSNDYINHEETNKSNEQKQSSHQKEECYTGNCNSKTRNQKSNR